VELKQNRIWAEISLANAERNLRAVREKISAGCRIMAVIKADAYGHGAVELSRIYEKMGVDYLAVATLNEALELRGSGIALPILILGITPPELAEELITNRITQTVFDAEYAKKLSGQAECLGQRVKIHVKADTGMTRLGFLDSIGRGNAVSEISEVCALPGLEAEGIFTHLSCADCGDDEYTKMQFDRFMEIIGALEQKGVRFSLRHCANSGGVVNYAYTHLDMVRPGILLYGMYPDEKMRDSIRLYPVMSLKSKIAQIKTVDAGTPVSYGRTYVTEAESALCVISAGYADGLMRSLSGSARFFISGKRAPQVGRICMDMCVADVTEIPEAAVGDTVIIFGGGQPECPTAEEIARLAGTIPYEVTCNISKRVPRIYI